ncbi:MAG: DUF1700 domain-containing protein [Candidatus Choladocola sp.]|nr:DUF1700 domain-containing protein [Candidatus Choladocola sp.]
MTDKYTSERQIQGKDDFLKMLEELLQDIPEEERESALTYYRDYFEEVSPEHEREVLEHLGSPEKVAAEIRWSLTDDRGSGEFTDRGYEDARFGVEYQVPDQYTQMKNCKEERSGDHRSILLLIILLVVFGLPLAGMILSAGFSVLTALFGVLVGIFGGLFGLIAAGFAIAVSLVAAGVGLIATGAVNMAEPALGAMVIALGFLSLAVSMLAAVLTKWGCTEAVPGVIRFCIELVRKCIRLISRPVRRIFGRGGGSR